MAADFVCMFMVAFASAILGFCLVALEEEYKSEGGASVEVISVQPLAAEEA